MNARRTPFLVLSIAIPVSLAASCGGGGNSPSSSAASSGSGGAGGASACTYNGGPADKTAAPPIHTPRWAFEPWISKDISDTDDTYAFVKGFHDRDIPVGAVVLDSPWETSYNTFVPNPVRYHDFDKLVSDMHADSVRVVVWITQFVNTISYDLEMGGDAYTGPAPNYQEGFDCHFYVDDASSYTWWKGNGAAIDYFNPTAVGWWHKQQDAILDRGIDGYKVDFGDSYVLSDPVATAAGPKDHQAYAEAYYEDFYTHGITKRGKDFVTMVRAWDESYGFAGRFYARKEHAPVVWMGDNRRDYLGLVDVLDETFRSAQAGYTVLGSDIGGYLDRDDKDLTKIIPFDPEVFARWTAVGALSPFMQLHGRANITPWTVPQMNDQITNLYRYWAKLHHELVPFFYSLAEEAYAGGSVIVRPIGAEKTWPGDYRYTLGDALLVAPILDATGKRDVPLPASTAWYDWWAPILDAIPGGQTMSGYDVGDLAKIPLFVGAGAIIPLAVDDDATGLGTAASKGKLTVLVYPGATKSTFVLHDEDEMPTSIDAVISGASSTVSISRAIRDTLIRIRADKPAQSVNVDGKASAMVADRAAFDAAASGWFSESSTRSVWVKVPAGAGKRVIEVL